ncbi:MAG: PQQ-like beta-propeller repeat protein [Sedimentisphaerales bacterium]|nr:PQQ-like beta-propeller repeat protein [Sedimentisphaerales bacterium]
MNETTKQPDTPRSSVALQTARNTAKVAGAFALIFLGLLVANFIGTAVIGPRRENKMAAMRALLREDPTDEKLLADIRQLDLRIRRDRLWRLDFARKSSYALLGSVALFLAVGKLAGVLERQGPRPGHVADRSAEQIAESRHARWGVAAGVLVLATAGALLLGLQGPLAFVKAEDSGPPYATMEQKNHQWHRFRGPGGGGVSSLTNVPTAWNGESGAGILWKTAVPLPGKNSPVVWGKRVFLSGATEEKREVFCFDADSGQLLWRGDVPARAAVAEAEIEVMEETGYSASTTATDGRRIYAIFATGDIAAFDFNGRRLWHKNLGIPESMYGYASSLDTYQDRVIVQYDQADAEAGKSRLYALNGLSGDVVWEAKREVPNSWSSPIVVEVEGRVQIVTLADPWLIGYDAATGTELWRAEVASGDVAPSPIYAGGLVMAIEPYSRMTAVKPTGQGNITETHVAWQSSDLAPDICCPASDGRYVYVLDGGGLLLCSNIADGTKVYEHELRDNFMASPSVVGDKLYLLSEEGVMHIAQLGPEYQEVAKCELGEACFASPAFADGRIYIRGEKNLYCVGGGRP